MERKFCENRVPVWSEALATPGSIDSPTHTVAARAAEEALSAGNAPVRVTALARLQRHPQPVLLRAQWAGGMRPME